MSEQDDHLLKAIAQGDREAFHTLYQRYGLELLRFLISRLDDRHTAEDVLQNVMLVVWRQAAAYKGDGSVRGWLYGIARNLAAKTLRSRAGFEASLDNAATDGELGFSTDDEAEKRLRYEAIRAIVDEIPLIEKQVIESVYFRGMSIEETARFLLIPANTVKTRLYRARQRLKDLLSEHHHAQPQPQPPQ